MNLIMSVVTYLVWKLDFVNIRHLSLKISVVTPYENEAGKYTKNVVNGNSIYSFKAMQNLTLQMG